MRLHLDTGQVTAEAVRLGVAAAALKPALTAVVKKESLALKTQMAATAPGGAMTPMFPASITFDMTGPLSSEVGPDKGMPQGALGNLLAFGSVNNGPVWDAFGGLTAARARTRLFTAKVVAETLGAR